MFTCQYCKCVYESSHILVMIRFLSLQVAICNIIYCFKHTKPNTGIIMSNEQRSMHPSQMLWMQSTINVHVNKQAYRTNYCFYSSPRNIETTPCKWCHPHLAQAAWVRRPGNCRAAVCVQKTSSPGSGRKQTRSVHQTRRINQTQKVTRNKWTVTGKRQRLRIQAHTSHTFVDVLIFPCDSKIQPW